MPDEKDLEKEPNLEVPSDGTEISFDELATLAVPVASTVEVVAVRESDTEFMVSQITFRSPQEVARAVQAYAETLSDTSGIPNFSEVVLAITGGAYLNSQDGALQKALRAAYNTFIVLPARASNPNQPSEGSILHTSGDPDTDSMIRKMNFGNNSDLFRTSTKGGAKKGKGHKTRSKRRR